MGFYNHKKSNNIMIRLLVTCLLASVTVIEALRGSAISRNNNDNRDPNSRDLQSGVAMEEPYETRTVQTSFVVNKLVGSNYTENNKIMLNNAIKTALIESSEKFKTQDPEQVVLLDPSAVVIDSLKDCPRYSTTSLTNCKEVMLKYNLVTFNFMTSNDDDFALMTNKFNTEMRNYFDNGKLQEILDNLHRNSDLYVIGYPETVASKYPILEDNEFIVTIQDSFYVVTGSDNEVERYSSNQGMRILSDILFETFEILVEEKIMPDKDVVDNGIDSNIVLLPNSIEAGKLVPCSAPGYMFCKSGLYRFDILARINRVINNRHLAEGNSVYADVANLIKEKYEAVTFTYVVDYDMYIRDTYPSSSLEILDPKALIDVGGYAPPRYYENTTEAPTMAPIKGAGRAEDVDEEEPKKWYKNKTIWIIIGSIIAAVILIGICICCVACCFKRRENDDDDSSHEQDTKPRGGKKKVKKITTITTTTRTATEEKNGDRSGTHDLDDSSDSSESVTETHTRTIVEYGYKR